MTLLRVASVSITFFVLTFSLLSPYSIAETLTPTKTPPLHGPGAVETPALPALIDGLAQSLTLTDVQALQAQYDAAMIAIARELPTRRPVVLDLDETLLDNRAYFIKNGPFQMSLWEPWILTAEAPALPGALAFVRFLDVHKVPYYFVSGRYEKWRTATETNLARLGLSGSQGLMLKPDNYPVDKTPRIFKEGQRCEIERRTGETILLLMGDQMSDLTGRCNGVHQIKLPNRLYFLP